MNITKEQQKELDDAFEPTIQVVLDALKLTPFYNAFEISVDVPEIYMQEISVTVTRHHSSLRFKLDGKSYTVNVDNFRDILKICPKLPDLVFQVENKNSKKTNDMYYPCFTKFIVDYFMAKDQAILRRNKMFWHYARDDFMFTTIRVISKHNDTQEFGSILPQHLTNQAMLDSEAFKTYRAYTTGEKAPKSKAINKKTDSKSSPKIKPSQASKGKRIKTLAKGDKPSITKTKGLTVLSEVSLSEAEQMKLATKRSLIEFHVSHASGSGDGVDLQSKVPDDQGEEEDEDDDEHNNDENDKEHDISTPPDYELTKEDENQEDDDTMGEDQEDEENGELYGDLNLNLDRQDAEMTDAQTNQETEEAHVTLTTDTPVVKQQSSFISSDLVAKFINPSSGIEIPNFASLFGFERRVSSLKSDLSELKQTNQFAEALSSILGIVDKYLETKVKDTVDVVVQLKSDKLRDEAQAENQDFLNSLDSNVKRIIKEQVKAQTSKIMTKVEKYVTKTLEAKVLVRSTNQPQTSYTIASSLSELELKKILMDKMEENNSIDRSDVQKNLYRTLLEVYNSDKDLISSYEGRSDKDQARNSYQKKQLQRSQSLQHDPRVDDLEEPCHQEFDTGNDDVSPVREATNVDERLWNPSGSRTPDQEWNQTKMVDDRSPQ
ncbi:hypothetical protein Tco_0965269 [Tanacetum coccineum]